jgi:two-component system phosphate regulon sensor histidine kinase PhoR
MEDEAHRDEFLAEIENGASRLISLVDDLLDLASIEAGKRPPVIQSVDVLEVAREAALSLKPQASRRKVSLRVGKDEAVVARADRGQLRQVLINLMDNAIKFNRAKGTVTVNAQSLSGIVTVRVRDTGSGIPEEDISRLFERFYRVEKARSVEMGGTGLGLSIVKHIIEAHNGRVSVESELGVGSTFIFTLPAA